MKQFDEEEDTQELDLMTVPEVAKRLRCDTTTVRRWIQDGLLEAVVLPHPGKRQSYRVKRTTLNDLLEGKTA